MRTTSDLGDSVEFRVLGSMTVLAGGRPLNLGGPKPRTLLAALAVDVGRVVAIDTLISTLWGENPPSSARAVVQTYVSTLRQQLGERDLLVRQAPGYLLRAEPELVDLTRFQRAVLTGRQALEADDAELASTVLAEGLALWTGSALGGVDGEWAEAQRTKLTEARLAALEMRLEADFRLGRGRDLVGELTALVADHPVRERLRAKLMLALHESGRQADAIATFHQARRVLVEELGVEPGRELQDAFQTVLGRPSPVAVQHDDEPAPRAEPATLTGPSQLPPAISDFTGRQDDIDQVLRRLLPAETGNAVRICAISGKPGSGKTTLAVHTAHQLRQQYPDGQLYATLSGTHSVPTDPTDVLARFLRTLGVTDAAIPSDTNERADLYRSMLAERRVLVVLDDAAHEQQVRPLIPAGAGCAVLVTSRGRMAALEGAGLLDLHELREEETLELLARLVLGPRLAAEPEAALEIVRLCGHLPLAVRIAGARLAARPHWTVSRLVQRLSRQQHLLNELAIGDLEVRGSLALSYDGLTELERTALRRLSTVAVQDFAGWLAAPLLDVPVIEAEDVVERLVDAQLLDVVGAVPAGTTRYRFHDLTRVFARELCDSEETRPAIRAALDRVARTSLELVRRAANRMPSGVMRPMPSAEDAGHLNAKTVDGLLVDPAAWFEAEESLLVSVVEQASELDLVDTAAELASTLSASSFAVRNQFTQWRRTHTAALAATRRAGDRAAEALLLDGMGELYYEQDRFDESVSYYQQALTAYAEVGDSRGQARTRLSLSFVLRERGWFGRARQMLAQSIPVLRLDGSADEIAQANHNLGMILCETGDLAAATVAISEAMESWRSAGNRRSAALALRWIGIVHRAAGRLAEAEDCCARAAGDLRAAGDRLVIAYADQALAKVRIRQGRGGDGRPALDQALATCNEMQDGFGQALLLRTIGELELAVGDPAAALPHLTRALEWWQALDLPVWQARTTRDLATASALLGDGRRSDELRARARAVFEQYGCREAGEPFPHPSPRKDCHGSL